MKWINHHRLFNHIKRANTGLLLFNLLLLLMIVFVPFPTALLAQQYAVHPDQNLAAKIYSGTFALALRGTQESAPEQKCRSACR